MKKTKSKDSEIRYRCSTDFRVIVEAAWRHFRQKDIPLYRTADSMNDFVTLTLINTIYKEPIGKKILQEMWDEKMPEIQLWKKNSTKNDDLKATLDEIKKHFGYKDEN